MRILPANSEGFWISIFVSWFCHFLGFLFCSAFVLPFCYHCVCVILLSLLCVILLSSFLLLSGTFVLFCCMCVILLCIFVVFLPFSCRFLIRRGWLYLEPTWKVQKTSLFWRHANHFFSHIVCHLRFVFLHCYVVLLPFAFARLGVILKYIFFISQTKTTITWQKMTVKF